MGELKVLSRCSLCVPGNWVSAINLPVMTGNSARGCMVVLLSSGEADRLVREILVIGDSEMPGWFSHSVWGA